MVNGISLSELMVRYRAKYNINQEELAKRCNLTKQTVGAIESGRRTGTNLTKAKIMRVIEEDKND